MTLSRYTDGHIGKSYGDVMAIRMSRSYRKNPIVKDHISDSKKWANRKIRNLEDIPSGGAYRKHYPQYDICDWWDRTPIEHMANNWREDQSDHCHWMAGKDPQQAVIEWAKRYYWK